MWVIAARAGLTLPELLSLNNLTESHIISPGEALIIGYGTAPAITASGPEAANPSVTPLPPTPRPTATPAEAAVCLTAFDDLNRDGAHDPGEPPRSGVAFTIYNTETVVANYITDGRAEPGCVRGLTPGEYRVTRSVLSGEVLTTPGDWALNLAAGGELHQSFGSFMGEVAATAVSQLPATTTPSPAAPLSDSPAPPLPGSPALQSGGLALRLAFVIALFLGGLLLLGAVITLFVRQSRSRPGSEPKPDTADGEQRFPNNTK
jgi:hypothetical protein